MYDEAPRIDLRIQQNRSFEIIIEIDMNGEKYKLKDGEKLIFGVKKNSNSDYVIKKELTSSNSNNDGYLLALTPKDTNISRHKYHYDVALQTADKSLYTVIRYSDFDVMESVVNVS